MAQAMTVCLWWTLERISPGGKVSSLPGRTPNREAVGRRPETGRTFCNDVVEDLKSKYSVDPRCIYLFGHSAGAVFALMMAMDESEYFAAVAVHAGAFRTPNDFQTINNAKRKIPLAIWVGTADQFFPLSDVRATRDALRSNGFTIEVTEIPGHTHWYYDIAASINQQAWEFLKKYELPIGATLFAIVGPGATATRISYLARLMLWVLRPWSWWHSRTKKKRSLEPKDFVKERSELVRLAHEQIRYLH